MERCEGGACLAGPDPCPGIGCSELMDECVAMFDSDHDDDVDLDDYVDFEACLRGDGRSASPRCHSIHDRDQDGDVDLLDFAAFQLAYDPPPPPPTFADWTGDGWVTLDDYVVLPACLTGPGRTAPPECHVFDADHDRDVDARDFAEVQAALAGEPVTWTADWDFSGTIDLADYRIFVACLYGPGSVRLPACAPFDADHDLHIDLADFAAIQRGFVRPHERDNGGRVLDAQGLVRCAQCLTGPARPAASDCLMFDWDRDADVDLADWKQWSTQVTE
jgi:hypothetical protein